MLALIVLAVLLSVQVGLLIENLVSKSFHKGHGYIAGFALVSLLIVLMVCNVIEPSFRWGMLLLVLLIQAAVGIVFFIRKHKEERPYKAFKAILCCLGKCILLIFAILPAIIFPQYKLPETTGQYPVDTVSYTLTDTSRMELYDNSKENRRVTIQFWYPKTQEENQARLPLVIFSHGAFGFRGSNYSTFADLASNGYVVCSIDHTYHSFFTKQADGKTVLVNPQFMNDVLMVQNGQCDAKTGYDLSQSWLKTRKGDMDFVLDTILKNAKSESSGSVYRLIDTDKIGLMGHSLGGATAAAIGRERPEVDAVVVLDGTMFGEVTDFVNGKEVLNSTPYPVPLLNIYNEDHYKEGLANAGVYANMVASANALDARQTVFKGAGHLNFTDLPLFSPTLAKMLGTGTIDSRYCIETMNRIVREYFGYYLKGEGALNLSKEY